MIYKNDKSIKPVKTYTDKNGNWFIEFDKNELKNLFKKFKIKKSKK